MICCSACNMVSPGFNSGAFIAVFSLKLLLQLMDFMEFQTFSSKRVSFSTHCCIYIYITLTCSVFLIRIILLPLHMLNPLPSGRFPLRRCWRRFRLWPLSRSALLRSQLSERRPRWKMIGNGKGKIPRCST